MSALCEGRQLPEIFSLDVELSVLGLHAARSAMGLSDARVQAALAAANSPGSDGRRQVLSVVRHSTCSTTYISEEEKKKDKGNITPGCEAGTAANSTYAQVEGVAALSSPSSVLQEGDVLIEVCGKLVTRFNDVEATIDELVAKRQQDVGRNAVDVTLLRNKKELRVKVPLRVVACKGTTRMVALGGLVCQHHHREILLSCILVAKNDSAQSFDAYNNVFNYREKAPIESLLCTCSSADFTVAVLQVRLSGAVSSRRVGTRSTALSISMARQRKSNQPVASLQRRLRTVPFDLTDIIY